MTFSKTIINWYKENNRDLPWRNTNNPYNIWISEIILQQTRVEQGLSFYLRFVERFPDVHSLADAPVEEVLKIWQGLGYYSRARNLHVAAKEIATTFHGNVPGTYKELLNLKGIGKYTAAAIASIAFNEPVAVVDGNVLRLMTRYFDIHSPITKLSTQKKIFDLANQHIDKKEPGQFNQAMMEMGAMICLPKNPLCFKCPLQATCLAKKNDTMAIIPVKEKKTKPKPRYFHYFFIKDGDTTFMQQREEKDIWQSLFELPLIETKKNIQPAKEKVQQLANEIYGKDFIKIEKKAVAFKHLLTHQTLFAVFHEATPGKSFEIPGRWHKINLKKIKSYPVSRLTDKFFHRYNF